MSDTMADFARRPNSPDPIADAKSTALFSHGIEPLPQKGNLIIVFAADWCPHCHDMEMDNGYAQKTTNGTPVRWMNDTYAEVHAALKKIPGITYDTTDNLYVNGQPLNGYPMAIEVVNGKAVAIANIGGPLVAPGSLDAVAEQFNTKQAHQQARNVVGSNCNISGATACTFDPKAAPLTGADMKKLLGGSQSK